MLTLFGKLNEDDLAIAARRYLPDYGKKDKEISEIPLKHNGKRKTIVFYWLNKQWVFIEVILK